MPFLFFKNWVKAISKIIKVCLFLALLIPGTINYQVRPAYAVDPWYSTSWGYRTKITIDHTKVPNTDQSYFPVLINRTDTNWRVVASGGHAGQTDGGDFVFTSSDGVTQLDHEIERYNSSTGALVAWVEVPTLATATDTVLYLYYGNAGVADQWDMAGTWDEGGSNNYKAIWHLEETGSNPQITDSTGNSVNSTTNLSDPTTSGQIDGAATFTTANSDYIDYGNVLPMGTGSATVSIWFKTSATPAVGSVTALLGKTSARGYIGRYGMYFTGGNIVAMSDYLATSAVTTTTSQTPYLSAWHQATAVFNRAGSMSLYVDGVFKNSASISAYSAVDMQGTDHYFVGAYGDATGLAPLAGRYFPGDLDEARVAATNRSADWIVTEYSNQSSPSTFYSAAAEERNTVPDAPTGLTPTFGNTQVALSWTAPAETGGSAITDYVVDYKLTSEPTIWSTFADGTSASTSATVTGLTNGLSYDFRVSAVNAVGQGAASGTASATPATVPGATVPGAPTIGTATPGNTQASVAFSAPGSNGGATITSYTVTSSPGGFTGTGATSPIIVTGLTNGTSYTFTVTATNVAGTGAASAASNAVIPNTNSWYSLSWGYRTEIIIDHTKVANTDQSYFPVVINSTNADWAVVASGGHAGQTDGGDLVFTSSDGLTKLDHEIEKYDSATGALVAWVEVPTLSTSVDTVLYLYYGNASAADQWNVTGTWDGGGANAFQAVWHMKETGTNPQILDSSGNSKNSTSNLADPTTAGEINGGMSFTTASDDYVNYGNVLPMGTNSLTQSIWFKTVSTPVTAGMIGKTSARAYIGRYGLLFTAGNIRGYGDFTGTTATIINTSQTPYLGAWHLATAVYDRSGNLTFYVDGISVGSSDISAYSAVNMAGTDRFLVGGYGDSAGTGLFASSGFPGTLDEGRIAYTARSVDWILTEYNNQGSPSTFYQLTGEGMVAPDAPTALTPTFGNTQVALSWTAPADNGGSAVTDYVVDYKLTSEPTVWSTFADGTSATTSATVTGLTNGLSYDFRVSAVNAVGQGTASGTASSTPATVPGAPTIGTATPGDAQASVTFSAPGSDGGSTITGYTVTSSPGGFTGTGASSPIIVTGLTNGTSYTFTVTATNGAGTGSASAASNAVIPAALPGVPTAVSATVGNTQISLSWSAPVFTGGVGILITDYVVEYKLTSEPTVWSTFADGVSATTSAIVTGLTNGLSYDFRVSAVNSAGQGSPSSTVTSTPITTPGAPTSVVATRGNTQVSVAFVAPVSDGGSTITSYTVTSSPDNQTGVGAGSPIIVTGLTNGTEYTFTVTATNAAGVGSASAASNAVTPATVPDAPTSPVATHGNTQASVSFVAPGSDGGSPITSYTVTSSPGGFTGNGAASPIIVTGLTNGTAYTFTVTATNDVGEGTPSVASGPATPMTVPGAPTIGTATPGNAQASVTFSAPGVDGGSVITSYTVTSSPGGFTGTGATSPIIVSGLTNGTEYTFTVTATNSEGTGVASSASNAVTPRTVPDPPTALTPTAGNAQVGLSWTAPAVNGGSIVTDYVIEYKLTSEPTVWSLFADGVSAVTSGAVTGLTNGSSYDFRVSAANIAGQGDPSSTATATPVTVPGAPTTIVATPGNAQASVAFVAPVSDGGSVILDYTVTSSPGGLTGTGSASPIIVTGLTNGTLYSFTVTARNAVGTGSASSASNDVTPVTVPGAPTAASATEGNTQASVAFTAPIDTGGSAITSYTVTSDPGGFTGTGATSPIIVTGLTNGTAYTFTVTATNAQGEGPASAPSNSVTLSTEPGIPVNLAATVTGSSIGLSWSAPGSTGGSAITDYVIEYQLTIGGVWSVFAESTSVATTTSVTGLSNDTSYDFRVRAVNIISQSAPSTPVTATPGEPAQVFIQSFPDLTLQSVGTAIRITNEGTGEYEYQYTWCVTDSAINLCGGGDDLFSSSAAKLIQAGDNWDTTLNSTLATPGTYYFHIDVTYGSQSSTAFQSFVAVATYPDAPTAVVATYGNAQASVAFTVPASSGGSAITSYTVTSGPGGLTGTGVSSPIIVTGLTNGTAYTFTVTATNAVGTGPASDPSNSVIPLTVPDPPTGLTATAGNTTVALSWTAPAVNGGSAITDYVIEYKDSSVVPWSVFADGTSTVTSATITGLSNGTSYDFRVSAVNAEGQSAVTALSAVSPTEPAPVDSGSNGGNSRPPTPQPEAGPPMAETPVPEQTPTPTTPPTEPVVPEVPPGTVVPAPGVQPPPTTPGVPGATPPTVPPGTPGGAIPPSVPGVQPPTINPVIGVPVVPLPGTVIVPGNEVTITPTETPSPAVPTPGVTAYAERQPFAIWILIVTILDATLVSLFIFLSRLRRREEKQEV